MAISFATLWEQMDKDKAQRSPLDMSGEDGRALIAVRAGKEMHAEGEASFWDEFISLCSNADGLSELLGVSAEKIRSWPAKVHEALEKLERHHAVDPAQKEKSELMPTGDNGAFTTNTDPVGANIGDVT